MNAVNVPAKQHTGGGRGRYATAGYCASFKRRDDVACGLKCRAKDCAYNMEQFCSARTIRVGRNPSAAYCDTYTQNSPAATAARQRLLDGLNTEFGADIGSPKIICIASDALTTKRSTAMQAGWKSTRQNSVLTSCLTGRNNSCLKRKPQPNAVVLLAFSDKSYRDEAWAQTGCHADSAVRPGAIGGVNRWSRKARL